jgi:hypothetical protein
MQVADQVLLVQAMAEWAEAARVQADRALELRELLPQDQLAQQTPVVVVVHLITHLTAVPADLVLL